MRATETYIRTTELALALASTYMTAVTLFQTSLYAKFKPLLLRILSYMEPLLGGLSNYLSYFDLSLLVLVIALSLLFWRRGDEAGFGRLFSLNMLMYFPSVIDFSMFNWINLILLYDPAPRVSPLWVFGVGVLLQVTYIALRYTVRFRRIREELIGRGAEVEDLDNVSKGQMAYLALLMAGTVAVLTVIYYATPFVRDLLRFEVAELPYPHIVIGVACTILIAVATVIYLRGQSSKTQPAAEREEETPPLEPEQPDNQHE
jgi:hypothetical protein